MSTASRSAAVREDTVLSLQLPYRERLALHRTVFAGGDGPRLAVVAGLHGDELEGLYVTHRLAAWLEGLLAERPAALLGTVELYPAVNPLGIDTLTRGVPPTGTDLNRSFPGRPDGVVPQRIADALMRALAGADLVLDVHASNIFLREIPQVRISHRFADRLLPLAATMNLDVVWVHASLTVLEATLAHSLNERGVPCLVAEMGVGMRVTPAFAEQILVGILRTCRARGVLAPDLELPPLTHRPLRADDGNVHYLNADTSGLFVPVIQHWTRVRAGQLLGRIVSPHRGGTVAEVLSPVDGVLFTLREYPLVYEGSLMARIAAAEMPEQGP